MSLQPVASEGPDAYLQRYLAPLQPLLRRADVTDIFVNQPGEAWTETGSGGFERHMIPALDETNLWRLVRQVAAFAHQGVSREHPLLSATLPDGARIQVVAPPATRGPLALAIRKHIQAELTLGELAARGAFATLGGDHGPRSGVLRQSLETLLEGGDTEAFLRRAVQARQNIVISGGTSTGKTTFANALIGEIPQAERLVFIEDAPELRLHHPNAIGLVAVRGELGEALVTAEDLLQASLRMRPDRIILGELRGKEALSFIRAANTGHPGSITTVHADDPAGAVNQMALMILQAGSNLSRTEAKAYIGEVVDIWIQLGRRQGRRVVDAIAFKPQL